MAPAGNPAPARHPRGAGWPSTGRRRAILMTVARGDGSGTHSGVRELELRHLRVVCVVADAGSLSRAAAQLGISQPALTAQLQRIERRLGGALFSRGNDGVRLTDVGNYVVRAGRVVLGEADRLAEGVAQLVRSSGLDVVRVGGPPGPRVPAWAAQITTSLSCSDVPIEVTIDTDELVRQVANQRLDFLMLESPPDLMPPLPAGLRQRLLLVEPEFVALPERHPLAASEQIELAELAADDWVAPPLRASAEQLAFTRACQAAGFTPRIRHQVTDGLTARNLVERGAVCLTSAVAHGGHGVVIRPLAGTPLTQQISLVWHTDGLQARWADEAFRCAVRGYVSLIESSPAFRCWWAAHPEAHGEFDAVLPAHQPR